MKIPRIKFVPYQPHCFAFGGFDIQMLAAFESLNEKGVNVTKLDLWSRELDFDIIHFWGFSNLNHHIADWAKKNDKKCVATILVPYLEGANDVIKFYINYLRTYQRTYRKSLTQLDRIVVLSDEQANILNIYFRVPRRKIEVIPNIVDEAFFEGKNSKTERLAPFSDYVLCVGNVCKRKNQLNLVKACNDLDLPLILIGRAMDGESDYANQVAEAISKSELFRWESDVDYASPEMVNYYKYCSLFVLPSYFETQPISLLEAMALEKPAVALNKKYVNQKLYQNVFLSRNGNVESLKKTILRAKTINSSSANHFIRECKANEVGEKYKNIYESLI